MTQYAIFLTTDLCDTWIGDSICNSIEELAEYIRKNQKLLKKAAGPNGDWSALRYIHGKTLSECALTAEENQRLNELMGWKS